MTIEEIISHAQVSGITLEVEGQDLKVRGKSSALNAGFVNQLRDNKERIVKFFSAPRTFPASAGQRRLWLSGSQGGNTSIFNITICCAIPSNVDVGQLCTAFRSMAKRHEILRTGLDLIDGELKQIVHPLESVRFEVADHRQTHTGEDVFQFIEADTRYPFDMKQPPLFMANIYATDQNETMLVIVFHHSIIDGWSIPIFLRDLLAFYFSDGSQLPIITSQYRDYVSWMDKMAASPAFIRSGKYWQERFADGIPVLDMPVDFERGHVKCNRGKFLSRFISPAVYSRWKSFLSARGVTPFAGALSLVYVLLHKYTQSNDIVIGTAVGGRPDLAFNDQIGFFVNTLPLRAKINGNSTILDVFLQVKTLVIDALANSIYPFDKIVEDLKIPHSPERHPMYDVAVVFQNEEATSIILADISTEKEVKLVDAGFRSVTTDLRIELNEYEGGMQLNIDYDISLFKEERIALILDHLGNLISNFSDALYAEPLASLKMHAAGEMELIDSLAKIDPRKFVRNTLTNQFDYIVKRFRSSPSIISTEQSVTYSELNQQVEKLAFLLRSRYNVQRDTVVAVFTSASSESVAAMLAIWKCGAIYLPLDVATPMERILYMLSDSRVAVILTDSVHFFELTESGLPLVVLDLQLPNLPCPEDVKWPVVQPDDTAYLIYTSGSTGVPKGVMVHHSGCLNMSLSQISIFGINCEQDRVALFASLSFDASISEMLMALLCGAPLVIVPDEMKRDATGLFSFLKAHQTTVITLPPSYLRVIDKRHLSCLSKLILAGEALFQNDILGIPAHIRIFNAYGPTEISVCATVHEINLTGDNQSRVPIGRPIANTGVLVLDENLSPVPVGVYGEICVVGEGVSKGYINNYVLTEELFRSSAYGVMYLTGDLGMITFDGTLVYIGRRDDQVKLNGFRIELDEIVKYLNACPGVQYSAVIFSEVTKSLVAFYTGTNEIPSAALKSFLARSLPHYMVPEIFVKRDLLPLTSSGKVDKKALKRELSQIHSSQEAIPLDDRFQRLAAIWEQVLGIPVQSIANSFFELGGDSLKAIQLITMVHQQYGIQLDITELFNFPKFVDFHDRILSNTGTSQKAIPRLPLREYYRLSDGQMRLWALHQIDSVKYAYNLPTAYHITGKLDAGLFKETLWQLVKRHEVLRTEIVLRDGQPFQKVVDASALDDIEVQNIDLSASGEAQADKLREIVNNTAIQVFDLGVAPLWKISLIYLGADRHVLSLNMHHLIADAWSFEIFIREFLIIYNSLSAGMDVLLPPLPCTYKDIVEWQMGQETELEESRRYWLGQFEDIPAPLTLRYDFPRPAVKTYQGGHCSLKVDGTLLAGLKKMATDRSISLYPVLISAVNTLLYAHSMQEDMVIGMPFSGRDVSETQRVMGFFVNTIALRTRFKKDWDVDRLVRELNTLYLQSYRHQQYGFYQLIRDLNLKRDPGRYPLFDVWVVLQNPAIDKETLTLPFDVTPVDLAFDICKYDLKFDFVLNEQDGEIFINYSKDLFSRSTVECMCQNLQLILNGFTSDPFQSVEMLRSKIESSGVGISNQKKIKKRQL